MSNPIPTSQIQKALSAKGFVSRDGDHEYYYFYYNGKKTIAKTKISRGSSYKNYDDNLFGKMKMQLRLDKTQKVRALLDCSMSEDEYIVELKNANLLDADSC
jgi:hypothetical protein